MFTYMWLCVCVSSIEMGYICIKMSGTMLPKCQNARKYGQKITLQLFWQISGHFCITTFFSGGFTICTVNHSHCSSYPSHRMGRQVINVTSTRTDQVVIVKVIRNRSILSQPHLLFCFSFGCRDSFCLPFFTDQFFGHWGCTWSGFISALLTEQRYSGRS